MAHNRDCCGKNAFFAHFSRLVAIDQTGMMMIMPCFTFVAFGSVALSQGHVVSGWKDMPTSSLHHLLLSPGPADCIDLVSFNSNHISSADGEYVNKNETSPLFCVGLVPQGATSTFFTRMVQTETSSSSQTAI